MEQGKDNGMTLSQLLTVVVCVFVFETPFLLPGCPLRSGRDISGNFLGQWCDKSFSVYRGPPKMLLRKVDIKREKNVSLLQ
ncbi:hypothetical protein JTE90_013722 [Oedothorax gibbosus]|uniref:Uncharacterized protein n=1 Tax=Oedothorax gibbosus TaxID=931172 RepID=A0AAV6UZG9_9ARAC|nr:hypothetical protein JTE90_013722 [Oedothorax gibbosus]